MSSGPFGTNWLDLSNTSNCIIGTYLQGLVDISGGNLYVRNSNIYINSGDISLNGRLLSSGDASLNSRLFLGSDLSMGGNLYIPKKTIFSGDVTVTGNIYANYPVNSINASAFISSSSSSNFTTDVSMNKRLFVTSDISFGGNLISNYLNTSIQNIIPINGVAGTNWNIINSLPNQNYQSISISSTGQYMLTCVVGGTLYLSNNYGSTWNTLGTSNGLVSTTDVYTSCGISSTGQYMITNLVSGIVYVSSNYGSSWVYINSMNLGTNSSSDSNVAISSTGQYMISANWSSSPVYLSNNYGITWNAIGTSSGFINTTDQFGQCSISSTGQYMLVPVYVSGVVGIYLSNNYGLTWNSISTSAGIVSYNIWRWSCISSTGQYMLVAATGISLALSSNYGVSWTTVNNLNIPTSQSVSIMALSISSTGQYMILGSWYGGAPGYLSTNYGISWNLLPMTTNYQASSISSTGNYMAVVSNNQVYLSVPPTVSKNVTTVNGQLWTTDLSMSGNIYSNTLNTSTLLVNSSSPTVNIASSNSWSQCATILTTTGTNIATTSSIWWSGISVSSTGQYQNACVNVNGIGTGLFYSNKYGVSWQQSTSIISTTGTNIATTSINWFRTAISSTGQYQSVCVSSQANYGIFYSNNYGVSWQQSSSILAGISSTNIATTSIPWKNISMSSTGQYQSACLSGTGTYGIFYSNNYGVSWQQFSSIISTTGTNIAMIGTYWYYVSVSSTGQYQSAVVYNTAGYGIFYSNNYGVSWQQSASIITTTGINIATTSISWWKIAISSTGQYQSAFVYNQSPYGIFYSNNYGVSWQQCASIITTTGTNVATTVVNLYGISVSSTGQYQSACVTAATYGIFYSNNYGVTWQQFSSIIGTNKTNIATNGMTWQHISMSSNGQYMSTCCQNQGPYGIFTLQNPMTTSTNATTSPYTNLTGYVGFTDASGTPNTATTRALVEINGQGGGYSVAPSMFNNFNSTNSVNGIILGQNAPYSLYTSGSLLVGQEINIASDIRIKTNVLDVVDMSALDVLRQLKPKRYNYIDTAGRGTSSVWGYIAQDVASVLDYSVKTTTDFIPNIYQMVTILGNKVTLLGPGNSNGHGHGTSNTVTVLDAQNNTVSYDLSGNMIVTESNNSTGAITVLDTFYAQTDSSGNITYIDESGQSATIDGSNNIIVTSPPVSSTASFLPNLISGEPIRLKFYDSNNNVWYSTITSIIDGQNFMIADDLTGQNTLTTMFLYGQEVEDFHVLDKFAIFTIATASLQELDKEYQVSKTQLTELKATNLTLTTQNELLQRQINNITERLSNANI